MNNDAEKTRLRLKLKRVSNSLTSELDHHLRLYKLENANQATFWAIVVKNLTVFKTIFKLLDYTHTGSSSVVLARVVIESLIAVEFMKLNGLENWLRKFRDFEVAEAKQDIDYLASKGLDVSALNPQEVNKQFEANKKRLLRKDGKIWRSWSHKDFDGMLESIFKSGKFKPDDIATVLSSFVQSSRRLHLSPSEINLYTQTKQVKEAKDLLDKDIAFVTSLSSLLRLSMSFASYMNDQDLYKKLSNLFKELDR